METYYAKSDDRENPFDKKGGCKSPNNRENVINVSRAKPMIVGLANITRTSQVEEQFRNREFSERIPEADQPRDQSYEHDLRNRPPLENWYFPERLSPLP